MGSPTVRPVKSKGIPASRMIMIFSVVGFGGLVVLGTRQIMSTVTLVSIPLVGEWRATDKPWRLEFNQDNTLVSSTASAQPDSQSWTSGPGVYSVDYFGTLWVTLRNGKNFTATLTPETPNRFDLIESGVEGVTVFQRSSPKSNPSSITNPSNVTRKAKASPRRRSDARLRARIVFGSSQLINVVMICSQFSAKWRASRWAFE
jgi:hypothetical protein